VTSRAPEKQTENQTQQIQVLLYSLLSTTGDLQAAIVSLSRSDGVQASLGEGKKEECLTTGKFHRPKYNAVLHSINCRTVGMEKKVSTTAENHRFCKLQVLTELKSLSTKAYCNRGNASLLD
jgi:hypothetical protein